MHCRLRSKSASDPANSSSLSTSAPPATCKIEIHEALSSPDEDGRRRHFLLEYSREPRRSEPGIVCSNSDMHSMLRSCSSAGQSTSQLAPPDADSPHRGSLTFVRKGLVLRELLSQSSCRNNHDQIFENRRRISTGSMDSQSRKISAPGSLSSASGGPTNNCGGRCSPCHRVVSWDDEKQFTIDPCLLGSVIEDFIKSRGGDSPAKKQQKQFLEPHPREKRGASVSLEKSSLEIPLSTTRRSRSVDVTAATQQVNAIQANKKTAGFGTSPNGLKKRYVIVDELDRPRKLSLRSGSVPKVILRDLKMEDAMAEMAL